MAGLDLLSIFLSYIKVILDVFFPYVDYLCIIKATQALNIYINKNSR